MKVATILGIFPLLGGTAVIKTLEGVVVEFLHGLLTNMNKNSGKKIKFGPHPLAPWGEIFSFFF
jgi:hypothetical protein